MQMTGRELLKADKEIFLMNFAFQTFFKPESTKPS